MTAPVAARPSRVAWLVLTCRLPRAPAEGGDPAEADALGATHPVNAVAVLQASPTAERAFRRLRNMIGEGGGSAQVLCAEAIEGKADLITAFNAAREQEYDEIITGCGDIVTAIEAMTAAGRYEDLGKGRGTETALGAHPNDPHARYPRRGQRRNRSILPGQVPCGARRICQARLRNGHSPSYRNRHQ